MDIVTIGECLTAFQPWDNLPLRLSGLYQGSIAGAESNLAIALARLGHQTRWVSVVGDDEFGKKIIATLNAENVDSSYVVQDVNHRTGVFFKSFRGYGETTVAYYRENSAASHLSANVSSLEWLDDTRILHLTSITAALSKENAAYLLALAKEADRRGIAISFDPNLRLKLWTVAEARTWIHKILPYCTWYFPSEQEFRHIHGEQSVEEVRKDYQLACLIVKEGMGARAYTEKRVVTYVGEPAEAVKDTAGAGDAFVAGVLSHFLTVMTSLTKETYSEDFLRKALHTGHTMGKIAVQTLGDWENLPMKHELMELVEGKALDHR